MPGPRAATSPAWLRTIRPAEAVTVLALIGVGVVSALTPGRRGAGLSAGRMAFQPNALIVLVTLAVYLLQLTMVGARKGAATLALALGRDGAGAEDLSFSDERRILAAAGRLLRDCLPLYVASLVYSGLDFLTWRLHGFETRDAALIRWEETLLRGHASVWMDRFVTPALTDLFSLFYFAHIFLIVGVLLLLHFIAPRRLFVEAVQGVTTMMMIGLALYLLVPAVGPKFTLASSYTHVLEGGSLTDANAAVMDALRASRDVFPSLHVALSGMVLLYAWRARRLLGLLLLPLVLGNWVSTVYLRYHYVIDVLAAWVLIPLVYVANRRWVEAWAGAPEDRPS